MGPARYYPHHKPPPLPPELRRYLPQENDRRYLAEAALAMALERKRGAK